MLSRIIEVENITSIPITVRHIMIPGGRVTVQPGERASFDRFVWTRYSRRYRGRLVEVGALERLRVKAAEEAVTPEEDPFASGFEKLTMPELHKLAKELNIAMPFGVKKAELIAAIEAATTYDGVFTPPEESEQEEERTDEEDR